MKPVRTPSVSTTVWIMPGPVQRGRAAGDALLLEAVTSSGPVITVFDEETIPLTELRESASQGHLSLQSHSDHVVRAVPLATAFGTRSVPAFGHILSAPNSSMEWGAGDMCLLNLVGDGSIDTLPIISLSSVGDAVQRHEETVLAGWFKEKVVVILPNPLPRGVWLLPTGQHVPAIVAHLHLLNSLLTGDHMVPLGTQSISPQDFPTHLLLASLRNLLEHNHTTREAALLFDLR